MKTAFACWVNRIAPVFDTAHQIHVVDAESGQIVSEIQEALPEDLPAQKALRLVELGIGTLVCGAISRPMYRLVAAYGIQVVPFVAGELREVIWAWLNGNLNREVFAMPGCRGRGTGYGQGGQRGSRMADSMAIGITPSCVCPQCGHREPHQRGVPCVEMRCPRCGIAMTRQ